ncbi:MAG TPA: DUF222 domain-containing protein [Jatrophihabitans sp.]|uniref:HNH endonuclease signature motif containing protein n=1 Tax=Jatrophihabitans sp. TaxID=1932789 RepID=UPI002DF7FE61|nr:DUF222 domain-containing protein [Jatrophihabitans sp.]
MNDGASSIATLDRGVMFDRLVELQRVRAVADAEEQRILARLAAEPLPTCLDSADKQYVIDEIACALHQASRTMSNRLITAVDLVGRFPDTVAALERGELTLAHARALSDVTLGVDDATAARVERRVLERAIGRTPAQFRACALRAVRALAPRPLEPPPDPLLKRCCGVAPRNDGLVEFRALISPEDGAAIMADINAAAATTKGLDDRTADQRRADAFVDLMRGDIARRKAPATHVVVALSTLLGLDDQAAELGEHGYVPAEVARRIAHDPTGTWRRILTDDHGRVLRVSKKYRPPTSLARLVKARDRTCRFPSCRAKIAEIDHIVPWPKGPTTASNLQGLCLRHHHLKHEAGWSVRRLADGVTRWTAPTGRVHDKPPDEQPVDATMAVFEPPPF